MSTRYRIRKMKRFILRVAKVAMMKVWRFVVGVYNHAEAIAVLVLASLGLNALLGEIPFYYMLPMWVEATMIIPVLSVLIISFIIKIAEWRHNRREEATLAVA